MQKGPAHALLCLTALLSGCGAPTPRVPTPAEVTGMPAVSVSVGPQIDAERVRVFEQQDGVVRLRNAVVAALADSGKGGRLEANEMRVVVTRFRLRSTGSGVWLGAMAGADILDVDVSLVRDGATTRTFHTGAAGVAAGLVKPSAEGRFNGLVRLVGERIAQEL